MYLHIYLYTYIYIYIYIYICRNAVFCQLLICNHSALALLGIVETTCEWQLQIFEPAVDSLFVKQGSCKTTLL